MSHLAASARVEASYRLGGIVDFASEDDYKAYAKDPVHLGVLKEFVIPHLFVGGRTALQTAL